MRKLRPNEKQIVGNWITKNNEMIADENCQLIQELVDTQLKYISVDDSGWDILYLDPHDGRYWELTYPKSEMHGGGPPTLTNVSEEYAIKKYKSGKE